jgi:hypothetical protein
MTFTESTAQYEAWLARHMPLIAQDVALKHSEMARDSFSFLRATFYRWAQLWRSVCPELASAPAPLAVGDLHVENFGTWRDTEGRLIWGVNDFDEAHTMPYANDLVRLAVSADLAIHSDKLSISLKEACEAILDGYTEYIAGDGRPYVLAEHHEWLRTMATGSLRDPDHYWKRFDGLKDITAATPSDVHAVLDRVMPMPATECMVVHRAAGLGSLGRERFTKLGDVLGGRVAREIKRLAPSAWTWDLPGESTIHYAEILSQAHGVPDPFLVVIDGWICRRLAPDCSRIELDALPRERDEARLLRAMGRETANIHLGSSAVVAAIRRDLAARPSKWLRDATETMSRATIDDWKEWRLHVGGRKSEVGD